MTEGALFPWGLKWAILNKSTNVVLTIQYVTMLIFYMCSINERENRGR